MSGMTHISYKTITPCTGIHSSTLTTHGDAYKRNYEVGEKCRELTLRECQNPCDAMPWRSWRLPADAFT